MWRRTSSAMQSRDCTQNMPDCSHPLTSNDGWCGSAAHVERQRVTTEGRECEVFAFPEPSHIAPFSKTTFLQKFKERRWDLDSTGCERAAVLACRWRHLFDARWRHCGTRRFPLITGTHLSKTRGRGTAWQQNPSHIFAWNALRTLGNCLIPSPCRGDEQIVICARRTHITIKKYFVKSSVSPCHFLRNQDIARGHGCGTPRVSILLSTWFDNLGDAHRPETERQNSAIA